MALYPNEYNAKQRTMESDIFLVKKYSEKQLPKWDTDTREQIQVINNYNNFIRIALDIGYCFLIIPFRINRTTGQISENIIQKVICGIGYLLCFYQFFTKLYHFPYNKLRNPILYFVLFQRITSPALHVVWMKRLWFNSRKFYKIDRFLSSSTEIPVPNEDHWLTSKIVIVLICGTYMLVGLGTFVFGVRIVHHGLSYDDFEWFYRKYVAEARLAFFVTTDDTVILPMANITVEDHVATGFFITCNYFRHIIEFYSDAMLLMICLTFWSPTKAFYEDVKNQLKKLRPILNNEQHFQKLLNADPNVEADILLKYKALKELSELVNDASQWIMMSFVFEVFFYYSMHMDAVVLANDWFRRTKIILSMMMAFSILNFASDIQNKGAIMRNWVHNKRVRYKWLTSLELVKLLDQVSEDPVYMSGGIVPISFAVLGGMMATLLTFFIFCSTVENSHTLV